MPVRLERDGATALLVLDRPEKGNALSAHDLRYELPEAWRVVREDAAIRVVVVTGAGDRTFTSGLDLTDPAMAPSAGAEEGQDRLRFTGRQLGVWKPIVTAVNGRCLGGGLWFVGDSDLVLASERATFGNPAASVGMVVLSGSVALARRADLGAVLRMAMLGRHQELDADEALRAGIVDRVTPPEHLMERALAAASAIARNSPAAVQAMVRTLWAAQSLPAEEALVLADEVQGGWRSHPDALEGRAAFAERREPRWADGATDTAT